ncbi:putative minor extracellular protease vpr [Plectosphaerella plurivora]|uniref:Minor extracellular protease vpr n=1 Tax=Plectosphaerella plurivora TaxID=936078 RepID=A0A9P8VL53_9PEZI|nr:putative minor extracellular protease vpr [Plectosphaerella plurivora]
MRFTALCLAGLSLASGSAALQRRQNGTQEDADGTGLVKNRYIFEYATTADSDAATDALETRLQGATVRRVFKSGVFKGACLDTTDDIDVLAALGELGGVVNVWPAHRLKLNMPEQKALPELTAVNTEGNYNVHHMTGVDKLHEAGIKGQGAVIAILGGGFGSGRKVFGGYDFVGDGYWPEAGEKTPDDDPMDQQGHGTHVAGIAAGNGGWFQGVAPEATILAYKAFSQSGLTDEDVLIDAFIRAYEEGADVITASVGWVYNWSNGAWGVVASRLVELGVVCTVSAGNDGQIGPFYGSSGASGKYVTAVASADPDVVAAIPFKVTLTEGDSSEDLTFGYRPAAYDGPIDSSVVDRPVHFIPADAWDTCSRLPDQGVDLTNMVVLTSRSVPCDFGSQSYYMQLQGARNIIFHNDDRELGDPYPVDGVKIGQIDRPTGERLGAAILAGTNVTFSFPPFGAYAKIEQPIGGGPSDYSSWGPTFQLEQKPDIAAPGRDIVSTFPNGGWTMMSGTSMAAPYVAGVAALYVSKHGGRKQHGEGFGVALTARILSSGNTLPWVKGSEYRASTAQVGSGLIDAVKVVNYDTSLSFAKWQLNDTRYFSRYQGVDITNSGDKEVTYTFELQPAGGFEAFERDRSVYGFAPGVPEGAPFPIDITPEVRMPAGTFRVKPGQTRKAEWIFKLPTGDFDSTSLPVYSGKMLIKGSNGEELSVPYMGLAGDLKRSLSESKDIWWLGPHFVSGVDWTPIQEKPYWNFDLSLEKQDFPRLLMTSTFGTPLMRWDIYEANWRETKWSYPPVVGEKGFVGTATTFRYAQDLAPFDPDIYDETDVIPAVRQWQVRDHMRDFWWFGQLVNGSYINPGNYTMRAAVLLPYGNPEASDNWVVIDTPQVQILPKGN